MSKSLPTCQTAQSKTIKSSNANHAKTRNRVDPDRPKRLAPSAYMIWLAENRAAIKDELITTNPDAKVTDVTKQAGAWWKELADSEKAPFQTQADTLREQYYEQMKHRQPTYCPFQKFKA